MDFVFYLSLLSLLFVGKVVVVAMVTVVRWQGGCCCHGDCCSLARWLLLLW